MLYTHIHIDVSRNIMTTSMNERKHFFRKNIPLTLYSRKGCESVDVGYVWGMSWKRRQTATYWPKVLLTIAALLLHSAGLLNRGLLRAHALCLELVLTPRVSYLQLRLELNWLELTLAVCGTWLYNCLTTTCFLWAYASAPNSTTSTGQGDIPISPTRCTCFRCSSAYLHRCISWLTAWSRVNMLQL